jgi:membrane dipeptidase
VIPIVDGHNDALLRVWRSGEPLGERGGGQLDLPLMREGGLAAGFFAIFVPAGDEPPPDDPRARAVPTDDGWEVPQDGPLPIERARRVAAELAAIAERELFLVRTVHDLERCLAGEEVGAILHLEGAEPIGAESTRDDVEAWYERGLRSLGLVWSRPNAYGHGVPFRYPATPDIGDGLTAAGKSLVTDCNDLGILVDCAHLNERGFFDVAAVTTAPLVVTHAGAHALSPQPRNLTDRELDAIGDSGGLVGIFFDTVMTRPDGDLVPDTPLATIARHVEYVAERIGVDHVALGSDWDGCHPPSALDDASKAQALLAELAWSDDELRRLAHGNWLRVLRATWRG